jgi:hypothetical protein
MILKKQRRYLLSSTKIGKEDRISGEMPTERKGRKLQEARR